MFFIFAVLCVTLKMKKCFFFAKTYFSDGNVSNFPAKNYESSHKMFFCCNEARHFKLDNKIRHRKHRVFAHKVGGDGGKNVIKHSPYWKKCNETKEDYPPLQHYGQND